MQYRNLQLHEKNDQFYFEDPELAKKHNGKSKNIEKFKKFLDRYHLSETTVSTPALGYLKTGRATNLQGKKRTIWDERKQNPRVFAWFDHFNIFYHKSSKSYVITVQPYDLRLEDFQALEEYCQEQDFSCYIDYNDAWWYPGRTPLIMFGRSEVMEQILSERKSQ